MNSVGYRLQDTVAVVRIDRPPVNALSSDVRAALLACLERAESDPEVRGIVLAGSETAFSGGADIRQFGSPQYWAFPRTKDLADSIEALDKPVVAAMSGFAMGGGLELALGAHYRVANAGCKLALPEVYLGLIPAGGGILRLPRLIPLRDAVRLMLDGTAITGAEGHRLGLIDRLAEGDVISGALQFLREGGESGVPVRRSMRQEVKQSEPFLFRNLRQDMPERLAHDRAAAALLTCIEAAVTGTAEDARSLIEQHSADLLESEEAAGLRHVFFGKRSVARGFAVDGVEPISIQTIALRGAGRHAEELADRLRRSGRTVYFAASGRVEPISSAEDAPGAGARSCVDLALDLHPPEDEDGLSAWLANIAGARIVASEDLLSTRNALAPDAATELLQVHVRGADGGAGLAEIVAPSGTAPGVVAGLTRLLGKIGLIPVVERAGPLGVRMWSRLQDAAHELTGDGVPAAEIDRALADWGFPQGAYTGRSAEDGPPTGAGKPCPEARHSPSAIVERCVLALVNEAAFILAERAVGQALAIDMILVGGFGFPAWKGGPLFHAERLGLPNVESRMQAIGSQGSPAFEHVAPLLSELAASGRRFR